MRHNTLVLAATLAVIALSAACGSSTEPSEASGVTSLQVTDVRIGTGAEATPGRTVTVHYTGWVYSVSAADHHGNRFQSSRDLGQPFSFVLGAGTVITGWDQGVVGMRVGGQRTLVIPPNLAYGDRPPSSQIPSNATLVFDIELLDVR